MGNNFLNIFVWKLFNWERKGNNFKCLTYKSTLIFLIFLFCVRQFVIWSTVALKGVTHKAGEIKCSWTLDSHQMIIKLRWMLLYDTKLITWNYIKHKRLSWEFIKCTKGPLLNLQRSDLPWQVEQIEKDCKERQINSAWEIDYSLVHTLDENHKCYKCLHVG